MNNIHQLKIFLCLDDNNFFKTGENTSCYFPKNRFKQIKYRKFNYISLIFNICRYSGNIIINLYWYSFYQKWSNDNLIRSDKPKHWLSRVSFPIILTTLSLWFLRFSDHSERITFIGRHFDTPMISGANRRSAPGRIKCYLQLQVL